MRTKKEREKRHKDALELFNRTHDILAVKQFLGHKSIRTTLRYLTLEKA
jgi:site-specific recombinase XerD